MKQFLLLILTISVISIQAQTSVYHPFPDSAASWRAEYGGYESSTCYNRNYYIAGDTVINSLTYHKIEYFGGNGFPNETTRLCDYWSYSSSIYYLGAIRQDTSLRKVYFIIPGYTTDTLLYDFTLHVGDTLKTGINNSIMQYEHIQSIDSILIGNQYRKRFNVETTADVSIIEGIGSTSGLIEDVFRFESGGTLDCFSQNNKQLFPDTVNPCELILGASELKVNTISAAISPNPFHSSSILNVGKGFERAELKIYNALGMQVKSAMLFNNFTVINREGLSDGIYFYLVRNALGQELIGKFIIN